jgi:hypothetical protein
VGVGISNGVPVETASFVTMVGSCVDNGCAATESACIAIHRRSDMAIVKQGVCSSLMKERGVSSEESSLLRVSSLSPQPLSPEPQYV